MFRIKICGITTPDDARIAAEAGADAIGINFYAGSKRFVELDTAKEIAAALSDSVARVGVFVNASAEEMRSLAAEVPLDFAQLHGDETSAMLAEISDLQIIKVFRRRDSGFASVARFLSQCDVDVNPRAVLVDAYHHAEYGGTGLALDWNEVGRQKSVLGNMPLILAGGLTPENVAEAIRLAQPFGVDVASGVESSLGVKDADKVRMFVKNARRALGQ